MDVACVGVFSHHAVHRNAPDNPRDHVSHGHPEQPAGKSNGHGFSQELSQDVAPPRTHRFFHANFACSLGHGNQHDVHQSHAANSQSKRSDNCQQNLQLHSNDLPVV